jgi:hypothetical protein
MSTVVRTLSGLIYASSINMAQLPLESRVMPLTLLSHGSCASYCTACHNDVHDSSRRE